MCVEQNIVHIKLAETVKEILHMYTLGYDKIPIVVYILYVFCVCRTE